MASLRTLKNLPEWLELDYHRRPRALKALWKPVIGATLLISALAMLALVLIPRRTVPHIATAFQAGPVAPVHSLFNNDCGKCHVEALRTWDRLWQFNGSIRSVADETCRQCHAGALHNANMAHSGSCVSCHREHHGAAALIRIPDAGCTSCHADLAAAVRADATPTFRNVVGFAGHPPFAERWQGAPADPGTISFNHAVHLDPQGLTLPFDSAAGADRRAQRKVLACIDCHQTGAAGTTMQPINYQKHCAECHPLTVALPLKATGAAGKQALARFAQTPAPHQAPEMVRAALRDRLTQLIQATPELLRSDAVTAPPPRPIPGAKPPRPEVVSREEFEWVGQQLIAAEKPLFWANGQAGCAYCHQRVGPNADRDGQVPRFAKANINERLFPGLGDRREWFPHSRFDHGSHRMLACTDCHDARSSRLTKDVLLPGIDNCRQCHNGEAGRSAPTDCIGCHAYHPPAQQKAFHGRLTIDQALGR